MKRTSSSLWILSAAIVGLGFAFIDRPLGERLSQVDQERDRTVAEIDRNVAIAHSAAALDHQLGMLRARVASVDVSDDPARLVATFVGEATAIARVCHVRITGFDGRPLPRAATMATTPAKPTLSAFAATTIELTVEGNYANLISLLRRLSQGRVPVRVEVASIERTADPRLRGEPLLDERIRVDVLHRGAAKGADASAS